MARTIRPNQQYKDKLLKLIPSEIVAAYMVIHGILHGPVAQAHTIQIGQTDLTAPVAWIVFAVLFVLTPVYLARIHHVTRISQLALTTASFAVWVYTLGGPFQLAGWYHPQIASVLLVLWTLIIPLSIRTDAPAPA